MTPAIIHQFPTGAVWAPAPTEIERLTEPHREEVRRNHIALLGEVPKAIIFGACVLVVFPIVLVATAVALVACAVHDLLTRGRP